MTQDAYWDEIGLAWTAIRPEIIAPRLKENLRRQSVFTALAVFAGLPLSLAGIALGVWTLWHGAFAQAWFFVTRGTAILLLSLMAGLAATSFVPLLGDRPQSVAAMIASALVRAQRRHKLARLGYLGLAVAALFGITGYLLRVQAGKPPALSPLEPLVLLALLALVLFLLQRKARDDIAKYRHLQRLLLEDRS
jgi:hypothetical protein